MQLILFAIAFCQLSASASSKSYISPPLVWLKGERIRWNLEGSPYSVGGESGDSPYRRRYMEFTVTRKPQKSLGTQTFQGQFNFWSTNRLLTMHLITPEQSQSIRSGRKIQFGEKNILSIVLNSSTRSDYNLYVQLDCSPARGKKAREELVNLLSRISLSK